MLAIIRAFLFFILATSVCVSQPFEGKITYQSVYKSKIPTVTDELFTQMMGPVMEFIFKGGNYRSSTNGTFLQWQLYINKDNKLYSKFSNSSSVYWNDGAINPDSVIEAKLNKNAVDILGYKCDEIILTCKSGMQKYYFNSTLKMEPKHFEKHKFANWYEYVSRAKAIPLKMIVDNVQFSAESVATVITPQKIDEQTFALPPDVKLEKSPF